MCDLGASVSAIPKSLCDVLGFNEIEECSINLYLVDSTAKKPMGRINDILIITNRNYVPVDFIVLDIDCNPTCLIILGRPFLRSIGAIIDMKEGNIIFQFPLKKGMDHFPRKKIRLPYESMMRATYGLSTKDDYTRFHHFRLAKGVKQKHLLGGNPTNLSFFFLFCVSTLS